MLNNKNKIEKNIKIIIDRESVCAGDDIISHEEIFFVEKCSQIKDLINKIMEKKYLPNIVGGMAIWLLLQDKIPLVVVTQQGEVNFIINKDIEINELINKNEDKLYFRYFSSDNENVIFEKYSNLS